MRRNGESLRGLDRPGGPFLDTLRVIGKLGVKQLGEAVALVRRGEEGELVAENLDAVVELLVKKSAFAWGGATRR